MSDGLSLSLLAAAATVGVVHAALGPDHYLPFIALSKARGWSPVRTAVLTAVCGLGHVAASVAIGAAGIALGVAASRLDRLESVRGGVAGWAMIGFGVAYGAWGLRKALRRRRGIELHGHGHGPALHLHGGGDRPHRHAAEAVALAGSTTFWSLFVVFVLGPCEPLIPLFILPASRERWGLALAAALVFGAATIGTMVAITMLGSAVGGRLGRGRLAAWDHAIAGAVVVASGVMVVFLGW